MLVDKFGISWLVNIAAPDRARGEGHQGEGLKSFTKQP